MALPALLAAVDNAAIRAAIRSDLSAGDLSDTVVAMAYRPALSLVVGTDTAAANYPNTPAAAPAAVGAATGGSLPAGAYQVAFSWVYNTPPWIQPVVVLESGASPTVQVVLAGATSTITVTPPAAPPGALGFNVYMSQAGGMALTRQNVAPVTTPSWLQAAAPSAAGQPAPTENSDYWQRAHDAAVMFAAAWLVAGTPQLTRESFQGYSYGVTTPMTADQRAAMLREMAYELLALNLGRSAMGMLRPGAFAAASGRRGDLGWPLEPLSGSVGP